jgi:tricorn protease
LRAKVSGAFVFLVPDKSLIWVIFYYMPEVYDNGTRITSCTTWRTILHVASPTILFSACILAGFASTSIAATSGDKPHLLQRPALSQTQIVFNYAGDLWSVDRKGGHATRLTVGVGIETSPVFSPDGNTIAFTGEYDGNTDVFTIPATGGVPHRVTRR